MEDLLQCCICCINFDENVHIPRQLPCQHNICNICLPYMKKVQNDKIEYLECPTCRRKHFVQISSIPKSLVIIQLIESRRNSLRNQSQANNHHFSNPQKTTTDNWDQPPPYSPPVSAQSQSQKNYQASSNNIANTTQQTNQDRSPVWDQKSYLRKIFNSMDLNGDGSITSHELQQTLRQIQAGSEFCLKTVELLIAKYDKNGDHEIEFSEFTDLFNNLNEEFENFLMMDSDDSGTIDLDEFESSFTKKGYNFSHDFFEFIMHQLYKKTGVYGLKFDNYIRIMARFDFLYKSYRNTPYFHKHSLEQYLKKTFFQDFW